MKNTKRLISFILAAVLLFTSVPAAAFDPPSKAESSLENGYASSPDAYAIYPAPQRIEYGGGSFSLAQKVSVVIGGDVDEASRAFLDEILENYGRTASPAASAGTGSQILLGIYGSGDAADAWCSKEGLAADAELFDRTDAYLLCARKGTIAILGKDTSSVFYGLATLQMMFSSFAGSKFLNVQIEDYAGMKMRGFIEGFYGGWNYEGRESLMRFARDVKMNTYIYASKTDSYHMNDALYPQEDISKIADLVKVGEETKVRYCWSVHISYFFNRLSGNAVGSEAYNNAFNANFKKLTDKFQQLYDAGVRKFAILNDDFGAGTHAEVVRLLNKLDDEFLVPKGCDNLTYCMQGYNKAWSNTGELSALRQLNSSIDLFWTGDDVNAPITQETVDFVKEQTGHDAVFWLNYPVNEHAKSGVYLGNITHYARDGVTGLAGAVSNPCMYTEANKPGLFQLASLFWNNNNYLAQADRVWEDSFKYLQPEVYEAYLTIGRNVANCPGSSRVPGGFPESEYLAGAMDSVSAKIRAGQPIASDENALFLKEEFGRILSSIDTFRNECKNDSLKTELDAWLHSLHDVATAAQAALTAAFDMQRGDVNGAWGALATAGKAMETQGSYGAPGTEQKALAGSKRLVPFAAKTINTVKNQLIPFLNPASTDFTPSFYAVLGGAEQVDSAESAKAFDGNTESFAHFGTNQKTGDYFGADLGREITVNSIDILQAKNDTHADFFHNAVLEYSTDGSSWETVEEFTNDSAPRHITVENLSVKARFIRLRLTKTGTADKQNYWTDIREITINGGAVKTEDYGLYASEGISGTVTAENLVYRLTHNGSVSLPAGGYTGIKFKELSGIKSVANDSSGADGLTLQYSLNGLIWEDMPASPDQVAARYVRLYNGTGGAVSFTLDDFSVSVYGSAIHPSVTEYSAEYSTLNTAQGSGQWPVLFDGDESTYIWTNSAQRTNHYIIVDFGAQAPIYNLDIIQQSGNPKFYNAAFYLSADKNDWGSPIMSVAEVNGAVTGEHRTEKDGFIHIGRNDLGGVNARYLKIQLTKDSGYFLRINEITINEGIDTADKPIGKIFTENITGGDPDKIVDGDISTMFTADAPSDGTASITYPLTENNRLSFATFLQDASSVSNAVVTAEILNGNTVVEKQIGILDQGIKMFNMTKEGDVLSFTVTWPEGATPSLYEIIPVPYIEGWKQDVMSVSLSPETAKLNVTETLQIKSSVLPLHASNQSLIWTSGNPAAASVTQDGLVTALANGQTVITATAADGSGAFATCAITVTGGAVPPSEMKVSSVTVTPASATLKPGATQSLTAAVAPANASNKTVPWPSNNGSVASVDAAGTVTAIAPGTAVITATAADGSGAFGTCAITVLSETENTVQKGSTHEANLSRYKVTDAAAQTVEFTKSLNAKSTKITVPDTVSIYGKKYKVTSVAASAFKNNKKITSATIGKNVTSIGKNAFAGCGKLNKVTIKSKVLKKIDSNAFKGCGSLKTVTIKSKAIKTVGKNAFKGINKNAQIKVPANKLKDYRKLFEKKGLPKTVKIKK